MLLTKRSGVALLCGVVASSIFVTSVAEANGRREQDPNRQDPGAPETGGGMDGAGEINAQVRITFTVTGGGGGTGALKSSTPWEPPACYYAPTHTPEEMARHWRDFYANTNRDIWPDDMRESFDAGHEEQYGQEGEFPDYNRELQGEGMFWTRVINREHPDRQGQMACRSRTFWVDFTEAPEPGPGVVDSTLLAELAWERTRVPDTEVSLNPADVPQKVNLATWIWLDDAAFEPVSIRAELDGYGLWAETTATPTRLTLDPGTANATTHPAGGVCEASDGHIGTAWTPGTSGSPPCGITYTRATANGTTYPLSAALTWEVTWSDSLGGSGTLPNGEFSTALDIPVEEVQTIVR